MSYEQLIECEKLLTEKEKLVTQATISYHKAQVEWQRVSLGRLAQDGYNWLKSAEQKLQQVILERDQLLQQRNNLVQQLQQENAQLAQQIGEKNHLIQELTNAVAEKDAFIKNWKNERDELIRQESEALAKKDGVINTLANKVAEVNNRIDQTKVEKEKQKAQIQNLEDELKKTKEALQTEINERKRLLENLKQQTFIDSLLNYVRTTIAQGSDLNVVDEQNNTLLHKACAVNAVDIVKLLIAKGCKTEIKNNHHQKPIDLTDNPEIKLLLYAAHQNAVIKSRSPSKDDGYDGVLSNPDFSPENDHDLILNLPLKGDSKDVSHHHNNGTQQGVTLAKGRFADNDEDSFCFGSQKFITGDSASHFPRGDRSISLWFKLAKDEKTNEYKGGTLFSHCGTDNSSNFSIVINHAVGSGLENKKNISVYRFGEDNELRVYIDLNDKRYVNANNDWIHLVVTSGNGKGTTLYLNGKRVAHEQFFYTTNSKISKFGIGTFMYQDKPTDFDTDPMFQGNINDVLVYQRALNKDEVLTLYEYQKPRVAESEKRIEADAETTTEKEKHVYKSKLGMFGDHASLISRRVPEDKHEELKNKEPTKVSYRM